MNTDDIRTIIDLVMPSMSEHMRPRFDDLNKEFADLKNTVNISINQHENVSRLVSQLACDMEEMQRIVNDNKRDLAETNRKLEWFRRKKRNKLMVWMGGIGSGGAGIGFMVSQAVKAWKEWKHG